MHGRFFPERTLLAPLVNQKLTKQLHTNTLKQGPQRIWRPDRSDLHSYERKRSNLAKLQFQQIASSREVFKMSVWFASLRSF